MKIHSLETGFFSTDGGAMFGMVSRKVWTRKYPVDQDNRCPLAMRIFLAEMGDRLVLFDTGVGEAVVDGMAYYRFHDLNPASLAVSKLGFHPGAITDVVLSHLHFDHCGGAVVRCADGTLQPAFPGATYWAGKRQRQLAERPSIWESDSYAPEVVRCLEEAGQLRLVDADQTLFPGLKLKLFQGHTDDQLVSFIGDEFVYAGDVIPMEPHVMPMCIAAVDNSAVVAVEEKIRLLEETTAGEKILLFFHDARTQAARLKKVHGRISVAEKISFENSSV